MISPPLLLLSNHYPILLNYINSGFPLSKILWACRLAAELVSFSPSVLFYLFYPLFPQPNWLQPFPYHGGGIFCLAYWLQLYPYHASDIVSFTWSISCSSILITLVILYLLLSLSVAVLSLSH